MKSITLLVTFCITAQLSFCQVEQLIFKKGRTNYERVEYIGEGFQGLMYGSYTDIVLIRFIKLRDQKAFLNI